MDVAVLYSGGKDSTYAIDFCKEKGWNIKYLLSIKPTRRDCYLFHYPTVEFTKEFAKILNIPHIYTTCDVADPKQEAEIVKNIMEKNKVDALVLGGIGLQETQIASLQKALLPLKVEVFAAHAGYDHEELVQEMLDKGYKFIISQVAADGLTEYWLGKEITEDSFKDLKKLSQKHGFHIGFEGGHADSLVIDGPIFSKKLTILEGKKIMEKEFDGYLEITKWQFAKKTASQKLNL
ncbi:diphthine--ammonia ligase [Candidatus Woesearchaeota archaeon]|nr:diphthine--ammonia ligase [Candidatus Woesearchaeota archaeon]